MIETLERQAISVLPIAAVHGEHLTKVVRRLAAGSETLGGLLLMANLLWQKHLGMTIPWWFIGLGEAAGAFSFTGGILLWREPSRARGLTRHPVASDSAGPGEARRLLIRRWCSTERDRAPQSLFVSRGILPEHFTAVAFDLGLDGRRARNSPRMLEGRSDSQIRSAISTIRQRTDWFRLASAFFH